MAKQPSESTDVKTCPACGGTWPADRRHCLACGASLGEVPPQEMGASAASREINCKIVYYGPGLCGKTTNLQFIYSKTNPDLKGNMISLATETERTLFFDFLPIEIGAIRGMKTRIQLYTVPGQVFYDASRKLILKGVDGVIFVADSQIERMEANLESMDNLKINLLEQGYELEKVPFVIQYNKRDQSDPYALEELHRKLSMRNVAAFEAVATSGTATAIDTKRAGRDAGLNTAA